jgi:hypothetical protein
MKSVASVSDFQILYEILAPVSLFIEHFQCLFQFCIAALRLLKALKTALESHSTYHLAASFVHILIELTLLLGSYPDRVETLDLGAIVRQNARW